MEKLFKEICLVQEMEESFLHLKKEKSSTGLWLQRQRVFFMLDEIIIVVASVIVIVVAVAVGSFARRRPSKGTEWHV